MFESLGRYDEAIVAAQTDIQNWQCHAVLLTQSYAAVGRCSAKLGKMSEAVAAFEAAIDQAHQCELPFMEMLARCDYCEHVLDAQGKRDSQLPLLGRAINAMVLPPSKYNAFLCAGIDADAAVEAFHASVGELK